LVFNNWVFNFLKSKVVDKRNPDLLIGELGKPYMRRWILIPHNRYFNIYLHHFLKSDDDRALHDHPWCNASWLLQGEYMEVTPEGSFHRKAGYFYKRQAQSLHRIVLFKDIAGNDIPSWTLFITGPKIREWGFACPKGWRHWREFCEIDDHGENTGRPGPGCE
jgi:hypothetical protein